MNGVLKWWLEVANSASPEELRDIIHTGTGSGKPFAPYAPVCPLPPLSRVLDFGCGLGRNFPYLKSVATHVTGYDLPPMIERCRQLSPDPAHVLTADWSSIAEQHYDLIFAQVVLQHIDPIVVKSRLADFVRMAPHFYLLTRAEDDFGSRVLDTVAETGLFWPVGACTEVDHDADTHQLQVLKTLSYEEARQRRTGHFEILFKSNPAP